ncbi:MAG: Hint domain [Rhodobacteraceae bacterium HLUCCA12]|nr:MAG: Hint domain [Rhodobacteraceae bacterium HLUCCA12]
MDQAGSRGAPGAVGGHAVSVYTADMLFVLSGANAGDSLPSPGTSVTGDDYRLRDDASPSTLILQLEPGGAAGAAAVAGRIAGGSGIGRPGAAVHCLGMLRLMAPDSDMVEVLVLDSPGAGRMALPLSPLRARVVYSLIAIDDRPGPIRLAATVTGAFARGTRIAMQDGRQVPVEGLEPGMTVITRDHGPQTLRWVGSVRLRAVGGFAPVTIKAGVMGNPMPLTISPHHRMFLYRRDARPVAGAAELLVQARHLVNGQGIVRQEGGFVEYFSLVFDSHEVIYAEGVPCESLLVCPDTLMRLPASLAEAVRQALPGLEQRLHTGAVLASPLVPGAGRARHAADTGG